jgi:hypothetical protein
VSGDVHANALVKRLREHERLDSTRTMGSMETCALLREAADALEATERQRALAKAVVTSLTDSLVQAEASLEQARRALQRIANPLPCDCNDGVSECYCTTTANVYEIAQDALAALAAVSPPDEPPPEAASRESHSCVNLGYGSPAAADAAPPESASD